MLQGTPEVKRLNRERIRKQLQQHETFTKAEVAKWTSLSLSTCNTILNEMQSDGEILHLSHDESYVGRPASRFKYNRDHLHVLAIYVVSEQTENTVAFAVANATGEVLSRSEVHPPVITYEVIEHLITEQMSADGLIRGISFGLPGVLRDGVIERCDVESLVGVDIERRVRDKVGITPEIRNDMDFIATGVYHSVSHDGGNLSTLLFPETGFVGCGFMIDGKCLGGSSRFAGELSYIAEGFGLSKPEQRKAMLDRPAFRDFAAQMVLIASCTLDPEVIMLMGNQIDETDLAAIKEFCEPIISGQHLPRLMFDNNVADHYMRGLIRVMLDSLQFELTR
jgi:ROK family